MLQTAFQKHPENCKQRLVSACFEGEQNTGGSDVSTGWQHAEGQLYAHEIYILRTDFTPFSNIKRYL